MYADAMHPLAAFARGLHAELDELGAVDPLYLPTAAKKVALVELERARNRIAALEMRIMASGGDVTDDGAHRTVADYVSQFARTDRAPLVALERLGQSLEARWPVLEAATLAGRVTVRKARIIVKTLEALRADGVSSDVLDSAESHLADIAPDFTETHLARLARRVLDVVAPEIGEAVEARALEAEERRAQRYLSVNFLARPGGIDGVTEIRIRTSDAIAPAYALIWKHSPHPDTWPRWVTPPITPPTPNDSERRSTHWSRPSTPTGSRSTGDLRQP
jgi:hypothetical protein